jgi:hypothetical protein
LEYYFEKAACSLELRSFKQHLLLPFVGAWACLPACTLVSSDVTTWTSTSQYEIRRLVGTQPEVNPQR